MSQFSSNEAASLEKSIDATRAPIETDPQRIDDTYELDRCLKWITEGQYKKVCLQFPDYLLPDSYAVADRLQKRSGNVVYIMGDSAYESCCVDYVTAQHVDSDAIIHFGPRCLSRWLDTIPCLCIYEKARIDSEGFRDAFLKKFSGEVEKITVVLDHPYMHKQSELTNFFPHDNVKIHQINSMENIDDIIVYIGRNDRKLLNLKLKHRLRTFYYYDPQKAQPLIENYEENNAILKRRRFLVEKIKDSQTVGIIIGTVVIENFTKAIDRVRKLCALHRKKYYVISVGRPTVAKLANFPEMDIYVLICCAMSDIFESRNFHKPIVTTFDVEVALNPKGSDVDFSYDLNADYLEEKIDDCIVKEPDVSLLTGNLRRNDEEFPEDEKSNQIALKDKGTLILSDRSGVGYLSGRTFKGLEQKLGATKVKKAEEGRKGIAARYDDESF